MKPGQRRTPAATLRTETGPAGVGRMQPLLVMLGAVLLASGCATIPVTREVMGGELAWSDGQTPPKEPITEPAGECTPALQVWVLVVV